LIWEQTALSSALTVPVVGVGPVINLASNSDYHLAERIFTDTFTPLTSHAHALPSLLRQ